MALGIGLTTTIHSVLDASVLRGLPFAEGDRIVAVRQTVVTAGYTRNGIPARDFLDLRER